MSFATHEEQVPGTVRPESHLAATPPAERGSRGWLLRVLAILVVLATVVGLGAYGSTRLLDRFSGEQVSSVLTHRVQRGEMVVTITEDGNVESASNVDIKCQVAGGSAILWIVEDGREVKQGEKLVELDKSQLEEQISAQTITFEKARSAVIQAEKDYDVAQISVKEYLEGIFKLNLQNQQAQVTIAMENLRTAQNTLEHTQRMFRKGYVSQLELESQQFGVQRAQLELDSANTAKEVLEKFTKLKTMEDLESKVETAKAKMESEKAAFKLEEDRLKRLQGQLAQCLIVAPQDGMVVYANEQSMMRFGSSQGAQIEEGAQVRERQNILRLPDLSQMQVKVNVHESKVESLRRGMRARIRIQDRDFQGTVTSIANQPEPTSFFSASVKEYGTLVRIDGETRGLRPGLTAEVEILVAHLQDVVSLPVAAIVEQRGAFFCWVKSGESTQRRPLVLGLSNDQFVEVKDGVVVGEEVLLNPRAVVQAARDDAEGAPDLDVAKKFGEGPAGSAEKTEARKVEPLAPATASQPNGTGPATRPAQEGEGPAGEPVRPRGPGGSGGPGGGPSNLTQSDKDGDGKISKDEAPEFLKTLFDRVDTNADGFLDKSEVEAMRSRSPGGGRGPGSGSRNLMQYDKDGDGKVTKEEAPEQMQGFFDRMDANGDGAVDQGEFEALRSRMGGGSGGGPGGGPPGRGF